MSPAWRRCAPGAEEALAVLHEHLAALENDPRVVDALVAMQAPDQVLLRVEMHRRDETGVAAARAAWGTDERPGSGHRAHRDASQSPQGFGTRIRGGRARRHPGSAAAESLLAALDSDDDAARNVVITALLRLVGLRNWSSSGARRCRD